MKRLWLFLSSAVLGVFFCAYAEDVTPGIYMSPERSLLAVHEDGSWEVYSNWADLPDNRISLGYMSERSACADEDREAAASSPGTDGIHAVWKGMTFSPVDSCPLFPTANEFAVSGMVWENDQLGTLRFSEDGTVRSDDSAVTTGSPQSLASSLSRYVSASSSVSAPSTTAPQCLQNLASSSICSPQFTQNMKPFTPLLLHGDEWSGSFPDTAGTPLSNRSCQCASRCDR